MSPPAGAAVPTVVRMRKPTTEGGPDRLLALSDGVFALAAVVARRPWLHGDAQPLRNEFLYAVDLGTMVAVFLVTIPLALVVGPAAMWWWLVLVPIKVWLGRKGDAATR